MRRKTGRTITAGLIAACVCGLSAASAGAAPPPTGWHVKITNLTTGQPMSAPLWAIHDGKQHVWQVGHQATNGAALIAEDALAAPLNALLQTDPDVLISAL